ncbi:MAG: hypothetical protein WAZ19_11170 [Anaerolineae bacterium]
MPTLTALLTIGLILRLTRLIVADQITYPIRARIVVRLGPDHPISTLITCTWCMSVWIAASVCLAGYWWADTHWWTIAALAGTASLLAGWTSRWLDPADQEA